jgi:hypothetical protein
MVNKKRVTLNILSAILVLSLGMILIQNIESVNADEVVNTTSKAQINTYFAITMSTELESEIDFGTIDTIPASDVNATKNYNASDMTEYYIEVSDDSNTNVSFEINASDFSSGTNTLGVGNESFAYNITNNNADEPSFDDVSLTEVLQTAGSSVDIGEKVYYRFWLDVPGNQPTGSYTNEVWFSATTA